MLSTLQRSQSPLAEPRRQVEILAQLPQNEEQLPPLPFAARLQEVGSLPLRAKGVQTLQINVGKRCNQACAHCHVDAGPDRKEEMTWHTMQQCLAVLAQPSLRTLDITGGAPELHPQLRELIAAAKDLGKHVILRCNLTVLVSHAKYSDLPAFFAKHGVEVIASLPCYLPVNTDKQRGEGVYERSIATLKLLNANGYGLEEHPNLPLHLVYNPGGASLPPAQAALEADYKKSLLEQHGIHFHRLYTITNMPISRFLDDLLRSGKYEAYMEKLRQAFNPAAVEGLMCRTMVSVAWDGSLYDCDFNQMLELPTLQGAKHISKWQQAALAHRPIHLANHCYGCTAGSGSSCGGALV